MSDRFNQIKILAPIDRVEEVLPLIKAGADEFFCGVLINKENLASIRASGIERSNLPDLDSLKKLTIIVKKNHKKIFLALNQVFVDANYLRLINKNLEKIKKIGLDGLIIGNVEMLDQLKNCGLKIIASSLLETKNEETADFLIKEFGIKRIIFDRQITLADMKSITSRFPMVEFETFVMESGCRSLASACRWITIARGHLCSGSYLINSIRGRTSPKLSPEDKKIIAGRLSMPSECCGACALFQFKKYNNIVSVKIVGRGHPTERKVRNVKFIRDAMNILEKNYPQKIFYRKMEELFEKTFGKKCERRYCYYPHFLGE